MKRNWMMRGLKFAVFAAVIATVLGFVVKDLWNWLMPPLFGQHVVTFEQALGLLALSSILFGGLRGGPQHLRRRFNERWERMTLEQREKVRAGLQGHGGHFGTAAAEQKE